jgi:WD40 repeat protein
VFRLAAKPDRNPSLTFSPDGQFVGAIAGDIALVETASGEVSALPLHGQMVWSMRFLPGRRAVAYLTHGRLVRHDFDAGPSADVDFPYYHARDLAVSPDGQTAYVGVKTYTAANTCDVRVVRLDDMKWLEEFAVRYGEIHRVALSADGRWFAADDNVWITTWHLGGEKVPGRPAARTEPDGHVSGIALTHDGAVLTCATSRGVFAWDASTGKPLFKSGKHRRAATALACSPTRPLIATGDGAGRVFFWDVRGNVLKKFDWGLKDVIGLAFAPDGLRCAAVDYPGKLVVWDVDG